MKPFVVFTIILLLTSCNYLGFQQKEDVVEKPIAEVNNTELYKKDIEGLFPKNVSKKDSLVFVKSFIESWATKQLLLKKAAENSSLQENRNTQELVQNYKETLLINSYKEKLVNQQLDTVVSVDKITNFYKENKQNFRLNEELVKIKYLYFGNNVFDKKEIIKLFKSNKVADAEELEKQQMSFKLFHLNDSIWMPLDNILLKLPFSKEKLLKKSKFIQKVNAKGVYLVAVKNVLKRNDIAPQNYMQSTIKQMILHKRKLELIREIEKIILNDAVQDKSFTIY